MTTKYRKWRSRIRALCTIDGKFRTECKACGEVFLSYRPDAQTCNVRCRKAFSRRGAGQPKTLMHWHLSSRADPLIKPLADRHYYRKNPKSHQFTPPGKCVVFRTANYNAFWITNAPLAQYIRHRWAGAWTCIAFRNEGPVLSSLLIKEAVAASLFILATPPETGFITFVNAKKVKSSNPGCCFKKAGWRQVGYTKGGLHVLQLLPVRFPEPNAPLG